MSIIKTFFNKTLLLIQLILVVVFIVFEEIIWEGIAKPIYSYIHELRLLQAIEVKLQPINRYVILILFLILLIGVEAAGLVAGVMVIQGMVLMATLLYVLKIPIAAFTFWFFRVTDEKLLSFDWFRWGYVKVMMLLDWIKSREIYLDIIAKAKAVKVKIKIAFVAIKEKYFKGDSLIAQRFQRFYAYIKNIISKDTRKYPLD